MPQSLSRQPACSVAAWRCRPSPPKNPPRPPPSPPPLLLRALDWRLGINCVATTAKVRRRQPFQVQDVLVECWRSIGTVRRTRTGAQRTKLSIAAIAAHDPWGNFVNLDEEDTKTDSHTNTSLGRQKQTVYQSSPLRRYSSNVLALTLIWSLNGFHGCSWPCCGDEGGNHL